MSYTFDEVIVRFYENSRKKCVIAAPSLHDQICLLNERNKNYVANLNMNFKRYLNANNDFLTTNFTGTSTKERKYYKAEVIVMHPT